MNVERNSSKYQLLFTFKLKWFRINTLFYITMYKSVIKKKKRISKTKADVMFFGYRSLPGGQMVALGWTEERSFRCIHCICTMKRYLSEVCPPGQTSPKKKSNTSWIFTSRKWYTEVFQWLFSNQFKQASRKEEKKKNQNKTKDWFPLRN